MTYDHIPEDFLDEIPREVCYSAAQSGRTNGFKRKTVDAREFVAHMTNHQIGPKDGSAWSPFNYAQDKRASANCLGTDVVVLDSDFGFPADKIARQLCLHGFAAIIVSTHSHLSTEKVVDKGAYDTWKNSNRSATPADFLLRRGYCAQIASSARLLRDSDDRQQSKRPAKNGELIIQHAPCPKFRIIIFLSETWRASDYENPAQAWKNGIRKIVKALRLKVDESCFDLARYYFDPRHPAGVEPLVQFFGGQTVDTLAHFGGDDQSDEGLCESSWGNVERKAKIFRGDIDVLERAVMAIKNDERFNDRDAWIKTLGAIHFETDGSGEGLELAQRWSATWTGGTYDSDKTERAWNSLRRKR